MDKVFLSISTHGDRWMDVVGGASVRLFVQLVVADAFITSFHPDTETQGERAMEQEQWVPPGK